MALRTCPHCGKQVSDTVKVCIHCGKELDAGLQKGTVEQPSERKVYEKLTDYERRELEKEFVKGKPKYEKFFGKESYYKYALKFSKAGYVIGCALDLITLIINENSPVLVMVLYGLSGLFFLASVVCDITFYILQNKYRKQLLIVLKKYQKWLKGKDIDYAPKFQWLSEKWQRYFNTVNADVEDI